ncbi:MAG: hypothetical protein EOR16_30965 [Mesorhizobium sp.]|nr:MAG: hypothetical protein EOR16_30965 [Mesorhizobium sp.]
MPIRNRRSSLRFGRWCGAGHPATTQPPQAYDKDLYKERNLVERFFNKLKYFRRTATHYDKLLANFMGFVTLGALRILLR